MKTVFAEIERQDAYTLQMGHNDFAHLPTKCRLVMPDDGQANISDDKPVMGSLPVFPPILLKPLKNIHL
jgi:hypothetical protein